MSRTFLQCLLLGVIATTASARTPEIASELQRKLQILGTRTQTTVAYVKTVLAEGNLPNQLQHEGLNRRLENMYLSIFEAAEQFGKASELLPRFSGLNRFQSGCRTLEDAKISATQGLRIANRYEIASMIDEFSITRGEILDSMQDC